MEEWAKTEKVVRAILFTLQYCSPQQRIELDTRFKDVIDDKSSAKGFGRYLVDHILYIQGGLSTNKIPTCPKFTPYRESYKELKAFVMAIKYHMFSDTTRDVTLAVKQESLKNVIETVEYMSLEKTNLSSWLMSGEIPGTVTCLSQIYKKYLDDVLSEKEKSGKLDSALMLADVAIGVRAIKVCSKLTSVIKVCNSKSILL